MFTERAKGKKALETVLVVIISVIAVVTSCLSASPGVITPRAFKYGLYGVTEGSHDGVIKKGDLVIAENSAATGINDYGIFINDDGTITAVRAALFSSVTNVKAIYVIDGLGGVAWFLHDIRFAVWGFWVVVLILYVVFKATAGAREAKRHKEKLINAFDYYGRLYEEKNVTADKE